MLMVVGCTGAEGTFAPLSHSPLIHTFGTRRWFAAFLSCSDIPGV